MAMSAGDPDVPLADQVRCVEREVALRERLYPDFVARRRMTAADSKRELMRMRAVLRTLRRLAAEDTAHHQANGGSDAVSSARLFP